jgi:methylmalonyl-CoA/ethylmalonyl-CoA epimerase
VILHQVAQHADDLQRAVAFYSTLLGEPPIATFDPPGLAFFRLGETRLLLERGAPSAMIYLRVDDVRSTVEQLRADGVTIANEPHVIYTDDNGLFGPAGAQEWMAFITDSEGNLVGLASQNPPSPSGGSAARRRGLF